MRRKVAFVLSLSVLLASLLCVGFKAVEVKASEGTGTAQVYEVEMLWNNSMSVNDVAVSKDGNYIAAVNNTGLYYFASNISSPKWWFMPPYALFSVAISADGEYVVAGGNSGSGFIYYFNNSRIRLHNQPSSTWSTSVGDTVGRGTLDMSDDGEYVVVRARNGVTDLFYFAGCRGRSGINESPTWYNRFDIIDFRAVRISSDGRYVAVGGTFSYAPTFHGFVLFYKDANMEPYPIQPSWNSWSSINVDIKDVALSDDGYAVVAVDEATIGTLYYWANATALSGDPNATWTNDGSFNCVDMSTDGDNVVAGSLLPIGSLNFWANARERHGNQTVNGQDWVKLESVNVLGVAISEDGGIIAASAQNASNYKAHFFKSDGSTIGEFDLLQSSPLVSMSGDGRIVAMGGPGFDSLYVFIPEFPTWTSMLLLLIVLTVAIAIYKRRLLKTPIH